MISATQLRVGMIIVRNGDLYRLTSVMHITPGNKRGLVQTKFKNIKTGLGAEHRFRSEDRIEQAILDTRMMQYLYEENEIHNFMDTETYEQTTLTDEQLGDFLSYLLPNQVVEMEFFEGKPIGINPPSFVELEVVETEPVLKGATATSSYKPAKLETGVTIMVPPFIQIGDRVRVDPSEGKYLERVK
ncbi:MAG: elongation factor P [Deltaproteobacteria bacterium]|nr:elongation factor P [Deltaproteobacteria bacterium]